MSIDLALLRIIKHKEQHDKVAKYIPKAAMDKKTIAIAKDISRYFEDSPEETSIDFPSFRSLFFTAYHKNLKEDDIKFYNTLIAKMETDVSDDVRKGIINNLITLEFATRCAGHIDDYQAEEDIDIVSVLHDAADKTKLALERTTKFDFATVDDNSIEEGLDDDTGLRWCIPAMNEVYRRNQPGDQTIIAARP